MNKLAKLRELVDTEINKLVAEQSSVAKLNAIHGALGKIVGSLNAEMTYAKARGEIPTIQYITDETETGAE